MPTLFNSQTRKPETLPEDQIEQAIASGTHGYLVSDRVNVKKKNGQTVSLPGNEVADAIQSGEYSLELPRQTAVREYVDENKGIGGQLKTAVMQFADEAVMGIPEQIKDATGDPLESAKRQALKKENAFSNALGGVAGFGASLLYGGPVGKAATLATKAGEKVVANRLIAKGAEAGANSAAREIAKKIAKSSAQLGVEGATFAAPTAITEAALGDPELAAETLLINGLAGSVLGAGGKAVKEMLGLVPKAVVTEGAERGLLEQFKSERAAKALGFTKGQIKKLKGGQDEAIQIGDDVLNMRTADGKKIIAATDSPETIAKKISSELDRTGDEVSSIYQKVDDSGQRAFDPIKVNERIEAELGGFYRSPLNKDVANTFDNLLETVGWTEQGLTLKRAKEILDQVDNIAYPKGKAPLNPTDKQILAQDARRIIREELNLASERGAKALGDETALARLTSGNKKISTLIKAQKALDDRISSEAGNKYFGLTDAIYGGSIGAVNPVAGIAAVVGKKVAEKYGNQMLANVDGLLFAEKSMAKVAKKLDELPEKLESMLKGRKLKDVAKSTSVGAIQRLIENADSGLSRVAAYEQLKDQLSEIDANASLPMERSSQVASGLAETGAPETASQLTIKNGLIAKYLSDHLPRATKINTPFKQVKWTPSDLELSKFERRVNAIQNPLSVIDDLIDGTLSTESVDAVKTVYPKLFENIQGRVMQYFMDNPQTVSYNNRIKLSLLLDMPLDDDLRPENIRAFQANFAEIDEAAAAQQGNGTKPFKVPDVQTSLQSVALS
jgi:hypothetical protein